MKIRFAFARVYYRLRPTEAGRQGRAYRLLLETPANRKRRHAREEADS